MDESRPTPRWRNPRRLGAGGALLALVALLAPHDAAAEVAQVVAALALFAVAVGARRHRLNPPLVTLAALAVSASCLASMLLPGERPGYASWRPMLLGLVAAGCITVAVAVMVKRHHPLSRDGSIGDGVVVMLAGWLVAWVAVVHHLLHEGRPVASVALAALPLPIMTWAVYLTASMLVAMPKRTRAGWTLLAGTVTALLTSTASALVAAGHVPAWLADVLVVGHILICTVAAMLVVDPGTSQLLTTQTSGRRRLLGRLTSTTGALVVPMLLLGIDGPHGRGDRFVRVASVALLGSVVLFRVVSSVRSNLRAQSEMLRGAQTDQLTGLPNRTVLLERVTACLGGAWHSEAIPTLYFIDLDRFKNINDSLGHAAGDEVLTIVAQRLSAAAPQGATVARLSGDEYVVLEPAARSLSAALATAEALLAVFREPIALSVGDVFVTASIGVAAMSPTSSSTAEDLLRHSDTAMYRAKDAGRNCVAVYDESMHEKVSHRLAVETALYRAIDRRELRLFHQPILDLESGEVVGFEALMRWQRADGAIVSPAEFIPIAEETGTIVPIGSWALLEALTQLRRWVDDGVCAATATMSVNVSPRQLADPNFPAIVSEAINRSGVHPSMLWLEVTESVMIAEPELALTTLRRLRSIGVRVALDDFGTGYSSLSLLQRFPLQRIKIDRAFVHGVADNPNDRSLVRTIVAMGRSLGLDLVAEGVENVHQLQVLNELGCTKAQGYLISHPLPPDAMRTTVAALQRLGQYHGLVTSGR